MRVIWCDFSWLNVCWEPKETTLIGQKFSLELYRAPRFGSLSVLHFEAAYNACAFRCRDLFISLVFVRCHGAMGELVLFFRNAPMLVLVAAIGLSRAR